MSRPRTPLTVRWALVLRIEPNKIQPMTVNFYQTPGLSYSFPHSPTNVLHVAWQMFFHVLYLYIQMYYIVLVWWWVNAPLCTWCMFWKTVTFLFCELVAEFWLNQIWSWVCSREQIKLVLLTVRWGFVKGKQIIKIPRIAVNFCPTPGLLF